MEPQFSSKYSNTEKKGELIGLLKSKTAILMVGAGSSLVVGYPGWNTLLVELRDVFYPEFQDPTDDDDLSDYAQIIKDKIVDDNRQDEYFQFLDEKFQPFPDKPNHSEFHISLVNLGFCGIVTTNYDKVLEIALQASPRSHGNSLNCDPLDLCIEKPYSIFPFLRSLNSQTDHAYVLHLHGCYRSSEKIILTRKDYEKNYGELDEDKKESPRILDTIHRKVIWTLLTTHHHVFVGFSLSDPFFLSMIKTVKTDFRLGERCYHYAIMGYRNEDDMLRIINELTFIGVCPIFYRIIKNTDGSDDHSRLNDLISELEHSTLPSMQHEEVEKNPIIVSIEKKVPSTILPSLDELNKITGGN